MQVFLQVEAEREAIERIEEEERLLCYDHHHHNHYNQHPHQQQQRQQYQNHQLRSAYHPPANPSSRRLEEEDPEWRDLNYDLEVIVHFIYMSCPMRCFYVNEIS